MAAADPHLPYPAQIEAYGSGGFRFAGLALSHRGSILCLPAGIWAWRVAAPDEIDESSLSPVIAALGDLDFVLLGTGIGFWQAPEALRAIFRASRVSLDVMPTGAAVRTYNVMLAENRRVAAGLIAVD